MLNKIKQRKPVILSFQATIREAITKMIDHKISSLLIYDDEEIIVGLLTERDVLRKLMILDVEDKLEHKISTVMTRKIEFVLENNILSQIKNLNAEFGIRHFPIVKEKKSKHQIDDIVGIITTTDLAKLFLKAKE